MGCGIEQKENKMKDRIRNRGGKKKEYFAVLVRAHLRLERYNRSLGRWNGGSAVVRTRGVTGTAEGVVGDRVKGGVAARYHCGTAKVEAIPRIPPLRSFSLPISLFPNPLPRRYPLARYATLPPCSVFPPPLSVSLFLSRLLVRAHYSKRPTAFARYLSPKSTRATL